MKRSNRLVLLIGIFLALIAFVLILVTINGGNGGSKTPREADDDHAWSWPRRPSTSAPPSRPPTSRRTTIAITDFPPNGIKLTSLVVGQIARQPVVVRPGRSPPTSSQAPRAASRTSRSRSATSRWPSRWTRSPASARSSRPATTSTSSTASPGPTRCRSWCPRRSGPAVAAATRRRPRAAGSRPRCCPTTRRPSRRSSRGSRCSARCSRRRTSTATATRRRRPARAPRRPSTASSRS